MPSAEYRSNSRDASRCEALAEALSAYVDGQVEPSLKIEVESHVRACTTCSAELARIERLCAELRDFVSVQPPLLVWDEVRAAASADGAARGRTRESRRLLARVSEILLYLFDGDLARRCRAEGTCRETQASAHGSIALVAGLLLGVLTQGVTPTLPFWAVGVGLALVWLASTRIEGRLTHSGLVATILAGAAGPAAWELAQAAQGHVTGPLAFSAALAALAGAQATTWPRLRPQVLGSFRVPISVRSSALVALAAAFARPDLAGPAAAVPPLVGAAGGALAAWALSRRRRAA